MRILFLYLFPLWGNGSGAYLRAFQSCDFDPDEFLHEDFVLLAREKPSKYLMFLRELKKLKNSIYRTAP